MLKTLFKLYTNLREMFFLKYCTANLKYYVIRDNE